VRDSALTVHGSLQAQRLGTYLASASVEFTHVFSSDLQRAYKTAEAICSAQPSADKSNDPATLKIQQLAVLREQDFGHFEGKSFNARAADSKGSRKDHHRSQQARDPGFKDIESNDSMILRMNSFLDEHLLPILRKSRKENISTPNVAIVSHGVILSVLWRCLLARFALHSVEFDPKLLGGRRPVTTLEHLGGWSNTGYLDLEIRTQQAPGAVRNVAESITAEIASDTDFTSTVTTSLVLYGWTMCIKAVNSRHHLRGLKRTGGGVGSSKLDERQKTIEGFLKKQKV
jgi:broad specificity phosphatase PhoE